jgi:protein Mpv17
MMNMKFVSAIAFGCAFQCQLLAQVQGFSPDNGALKIGTFNSSPLYPKARNDYLASSFSRTSRLAMPDLPQVINPDENTDESESGFQTDPVAALSKKIESMDLNGIFNTCAIALIGVVVLSKLATVDVGIMRGWTAAEMSVRIPIDNWLGYSAVLENSPVSTKAVTSATVYTIGDFIAQRTEGVTMGELDRPRLLRSLLAGLIGHGPMSHVWYDKSEYVFDQVFHWTEWWSFVPKVIVDQATWGPLWNNTYILLLGLMKFDKLENIWGDMKRTTIPLIVSGLKLWPLAHCVTYGLVPVENRLLWVDLVEIIWVTILASTAADAAHGGGSPPAEAEEKS